MSSDNTPDEIRATSAALAEPLQDFELFCHGEWQRTQPSANPSVLYHYCTAEAFRSIVGSGVVWASDIRFMNDASEMSYAAGLFRSAIENANVQTENHDERELMQRVTRSLDFREMFHVFAFCCSELHDSIPQWISYGARRGGLAIGLDLHRHVLQAHDQQNQTIEHTLIKVVYDPQVQRGIVESLVARILPIYRKAKAQFAEKLWSFIKAEICQAVRIGIADLLLTFKQLGFMHEQEWRLIFTQEKWTATPQYNVRSIGLVPYMPVRLTHRVGGYTDRLPLREIIQGPTAEPELAMEALRGFARHFGFTQTNLKSSEMPLRF